MTHTKFNFLFISHIQLGTKLLYENYYLSYSNIKSTGKKAFKCLLQIKA